MSPYLYQKLESLDEAEKFLRTYALRNGFASQKHAKVSKMYVDYRGGIKIIVV